MATNSKIEWTDHMWNPWYGCPDDGKRSEACDNCYARSWARRSGIVDFDSEVKRAADKTFFAPLNREKYKSGDRVFVCSLSDFFHEAVPNELRNEAYQKVIRDREDLTWIFFTKRPENICADTCGGNWPSAHHMKNNFWLGVTAENQETADERIPMLLSIPAAVRFVSVEPMLEPIDLGKYLGEASAVCSDCGIVESKIEIGIEDCDEVCEDCGLSVDFIAGLDWVIVGAAFGPGARAVHPDWIRGVRDQCLKAGVPFLFKQWGEWAQVYDRDIDDPDWRLCDAVVRETPRGRWLNLAGGCGFHGERVVRVDRVGKKKAGRELDGKIWDEFPGMPVEG